MKRRKDEYEYQSDAEFIQGILEFEKMMEEENDKLSMERKRKIDSKEIH